MSYGITGQLKFGLYATGMLYVEIGSYGLRPDSDFIVESSGLWSGFIPIKPEMVAALYFNGATDYWQIPNTDCGKSVHVLEYIPIDGCDESPTLLITGDEVERFEFEVMGFCDKPSALVDVDKVARKGDSEASEPPKEWARGIRRVAFCAARGIVHRGDKLTAGGLEQAMLDSRMVELKGDEYQLKSTDAGLGEREMKAKPKTIAGWVTTLKKLLN